MAEERCSYCKNIIFPHMERCPHCALPGLFPNVRAAKKTEERDALQTRYNEAISDSVARGCKKEAKAFEASVSKSVAVIARNNSESLRLATSDNELFSTYYKLMDAEVRLPIGEKWDALRQAADVAVFPNYYKNIRFAALSLDGRGSSNYGECFWVLEEKMIAHRTTVFTENIVLFMKNNSIKMDEAHKLPNGHRATWNERAKLCVAKLSNKLAQGMASADFKKVLLSEGKTSETDSFVEVHIWGPISQHTINKMIMKTPKSKRKKIFMQVICEQLKKVGVAIVVI